MSHSKWIRNRVTNYKHGNILNKQENTGKQLTFPDLL